MGKKKAKQSKPGPKAERLAIKGNWRDAMKKAVSVEKPPGGWPKPPEKKGKRRAKERESEEESD